MTRFNDSSVEEADSSTYEIDSSSSTESSNEKIMVRAKKPTYVGMSVELYMWLVSLLMLAIGLLHLLMISYTSAGIRGGYIITIMFGLLGPISGIYWIICIMFAVLGFKALYQTHRDYYTAASWFRRWVRTTRFLFVALLVCLVQFIFGCYMFAKGTSIGYNIDHILSRRGIASNSYKALIVRYLGSLHDDLVMGNPNYAISYPLNFLYGCGKQLGVSIPFVIIVPTLILSTGITAQEVYYNWRFEKAGIAID